MNRTDAFNLPKIQHRRTHGNNNKHCINNRQAHDSDSYEYVYPLYATPPIKNANDNDDDSATINANVKNRSRSILTITAAVLYTAVGVSAATGLFGMGNTYGMSTYVWDLGVSVASAALATVWVKLLTTMNAKGVIDSKLSRKLIHTTSAPLFILLWPFFSAEYAARYLAGVVVTLNAVKLVMAGSGVAGNAELASAVSRSGDEKEALGGPFVYCIIFLCATILFWRDSLTGVTAVSMMAAGDGMADIIGRRFGGNNKWPFLPDGNKSVAGSLAFFVSSFVATFGLALWLSYTGALTTSLSMSIASLASSILFISFVCTIVELLPFGDDNWTVPIVGGILAELILS